MLCPPGYHAPVTSERDPGPQDAAGSHPVAIGAVAAGPESEVDFRVLGPLEILVDGRPRAMPGGKPKGLLAVLLINRNRVVPSDAIADAIWDGEPPAGYPGILQVYVSTLRKALRTAGADRQAVVTTQAPGYRLLIDDARVDLGRFTRGCAAGNELIRGRRYAEASATLRAALAEWSGQALADLRSLRFAEDFAAAVEEERLVALQARIEADLACGSDSAVVGELTTLTTAHPLREPFWVQLITALYRLGRQADALEASRRIRELLADELGIDPSPALRDLERKILRQEPLDSAPAPASPSMLQTVSETAVVLSTARVVLPSGKAVPVPARGLRIGRMEDNDLVIEGVKVSRYHAVVVPAAHGCAINDLRSTNGSFVGGERVLDSHFLRHGDVIRIGGTELVFEFDDG
jgi:DNA-binding SARP family transcriptional activator